MKRRYLKKPEDNDAEKFDGKKPTKGNKSDSDEEEKVNVDNEDREGL